MNLDIGVGAGFHETVPRGDVCIDIINPHFRLPMFVRCDAQNLPFRSKIFDRISAFNVLEHIPDPWKCLGEMKRVGRTLVICQDMFFSFYCYATWDHLWLQLPGLRFVKYPRTRLGIAFSKWLRHAVKMFRRITGLVHFTVFWPWLNKALQPRYTKVIDVCD